MDQRILQAIEDILCSKVLSSSTVSGGDINHSLLLQIADGTKLFAKYNTTDKHQLIIGSDHDGLVLLQNGGIITPEIIAYHTTDEFSFLILDHIETGLSNVISHRSIAIQLATLHKNTSDYFGLAYDNMIGSLDQKNDQTTSFIEFYINQRVGVQYKLAYDHGFLRGIDMNSFYKNVKKLIPVEQPCLIHGDLWGGNYLISKKSEAVFIDPSVAYSHREFDLAMMKLFGGFDLDIFSIYNEFLPLEKGWEGRSEVFQLYYLMVHLNIFGQSYEGQVRDIISRYL